MKYIMRYSILSLSFLVFLSMGNINYRSLTIGDADEYALVKKPSAIHHTVYFKLKYAAGSKEEHDFFKASEVLIQIPGVKNFQRLKETSKKNNFDHGFAMEFASQELYDRYSNHPDHNKFVQEFWVPYVTEFMEIDFEVVKE